MSNKYKVDVNELTKSYRTKFDMSHQVKGSFLHGKLVPFDVIEVLPGDTFKIDLASIIRMSTPIAPIMDNIHMHVAAYFVPNRIVYDNWEELMGVNKNGAWLTSQGNYVVPKVSASLLSASSIGDYCGITVGIPSANSIVVNALPGRGIASIWNEYYRSPVVSAPLPVDHSSNNRVLVSSSTVLGDTFSTVFYDANPLPLAKFADYFTRALPSPIKHAPVPFLGGDLPIIGVADSGSLLTNKTFATGTIHSGGTVSVTGGSLGTDNASLLADVDQTWNTIEALRTAFQLDKFYYKDMYARNYGSMLEAHFNVLNKDSVLQIPQKIGELRWRINVDQVLSTAGYSASSSTTVGAPGANSVTTGKGSLTTFSATEHGFIIILGGARHDHTYSASLNKMWSRSDRLDYYDPCFANIGEQPVYNQEIDGGSGYPTGVFGYQEAWAEYRHQFDRVCGILNPTVSGSLDFWTLADSFTSTPLLNETFIYENRNSLSRALVTATTGPDYIFDFYFKVTAVREMPLFSIPGLADHH